MLPYTSYLDIDPNDSYIIPLYSVPLIHLKLNDWEHKKKVLMEAYNNISSDPNKFFKIGSSKSTVKTDFHYNNNTEDFSTSDLILDLLEEELNFISGIFNCDLQINNSWFEKTSSRESHTTHSHGAIGLSCVIFLKFDPKYHAPTVFIDPFLGSNSPIAPNNQMPPGIREGSMIIFPSYLYHYTVVNESEVDRIILSFNINIFDIQPDLRKVDNCEINKYQEYAVPDSEI